MSRLMIRETGCKSGTAGEGNARSAKLEKRSRHEEVLDEEAQGVGSEG